MSESVFVSTLRSALEERAAESHTNYHYRAGEMQTCLRRLPQLAAYKQFLDGSRERKAAGLAGGPEFEAHVLTQARAAREIAREASGVMLDIMEHYTHSGELERLTEAAVTAATEAGEVPLSSLWAELRDGGARDFLRDNGFSADSLAELDRALEERSAVLGAEEGVLRISDGENEIRLSARPAPVLRLRDGTAVRYKPDRVSLAAAGFRTTGRMGLGFVPIGQGKGTPEPRVVPLGDAVAGSLAWMVNVLDGHVTRLEETGLKTYAGSDPGTIGAIISIALVVGGAIVIGYGIYKITEGDILEGLVIILVGLGMIALGLSGIGGELVSWAISTVEEEITSIAAALA